MPKAISAWRMARSFIGNTATQESVELDFNIGSREAIEIAGILGTLAPTAAVATGTPTPVLSEQTLHAEDGTIQALNSPASAADQFERDSEVLYHQVLSVIAFDGSTEAAGAIAVTPSGWVTYPRPILLPFNPTHRSDNEGAVLDVGATLLLMYRYVQLSDTELALEFARRRR